MQITNPDVLKDDYEHQGFVVVDELFEKVEVSEFQRVTNELVEQSGSLRKSNPQFDLEPEHSEANPRVQRIKVPHKRNVVFGQAVRNPKLLQMLKILLGENVRFRNSKLNIKAAHGGSAVDWHQDWAFYPHTNTDLLAVGIMIDDIDEDNAPLMV
ncbi:MAG: phytanoyl-CoA dioxygenase family protein, partial [SAR324 cluster bacterium]|nr:phytanoyl-CoA dioxygenase family protein [SAR324 cluster bacterium]